MADDSAPASPGFASQMRAILRRHDLPEAQRVACVLRLLQEDTRPEDAKQKLLILLLAKEYSNVIGTPEAPAAGSAEIATDNVDEGLSDLSSVPESFLYDTDSSDGQGVLAADLFATSEEPDARPQDDKKVAPSEAANDDDSGKDLSEGAHTVHIRRDVLQAIEAGTFDELYEFYATEKSSINGYVLDIENPYLTVYDRDTKKSVGVMEDLFPVAYQELKAAKAVRDETDGEDGVSQYLPKNPNRPGQKGAKFSLIFPEQRQDRATLDETDIGKFVLFFKDRTTNDLRTEIYRHLESFQWDLSGDVNRLNKWRHQTVYRREGQIRFEDSDEPWTVVEQNMLEVFLKCLLEAAKKAKEKDAFERIKWILVSQDFKATIGYQPANTPVAVVDKKSKDGKDFRRKLQYDRPLTSFTSDQVQSRAQRTLDTHIKPHELTSEERAIFAGRNWARYLFPYEKAPKPALDDNQGDDDDDQDDKPPGPQRRRKGNALAPAKIATPKKPASKSPLKKSGASKKGSKPSKQSAVQDDEDRDGDEYLNVGGDDDGEYKPKETDSAVESDHTKAAPPPAKKARGQLKLSTGAPDNTTLKRRSPRKAAVSAPRQSKIVILKGTLDAALARSNARSSAAAPRHVSGFTPINIPAARAPVAANQNDQHVAATRGKEAPKPQAPTRQSQRKAAPATPIAVRRMNNAKARQAQDLQKNQRLFLRRQKLAQKSGVKPVLNVEKAQKIWKRQQKREKFGQPTPALGHSRVYKDGYISYSSGGEDDGEEEEEEEEAVPSPASGPPSKKGPKRDRSPSSSPSAPSGKRVRFTAAEAPTVKT